MKHMPQTVSVLAAIVGVAIALLAVGYIYLSWQDKKQRNFDRSMALLSIATAEAERDVRRKIEAHAPLDVAIRDVSNGEACVRAKQLTNRALVFNMSDAAWLYESITCENDVAIIVSGDICGKYLVRYAFGGTQIVTLSEVPDWAKVSLGLQQTAEVSR